MCNPETTLCGIPELFSAKSNFYNSALLNMQLSYTKLVYVREDRRQAVE